MEFLLPDLGEGIQEAQVLKLLVAEGDTVTADQPLMEVETDKAAVEIPSPVAGKVVKLHAGEGEIVNTGKPLVTFDTGDGAADAATASKTTKPAPSRKAPAANPPTFMAPPPAPGATPADVRAAPVVRKLAKQLSVDLRFVQGTGKRGRILRDDVQNAAAAGTAPVGGASVGPVSPGRGPSGPAGGIAAAPAVRPVTRPPILPITAPPGEPGQDAYGPVRIDGLSQVRKAIAAQMTKSVYSIPHCTNFEDADITELDKLRRGFNRPDQPERKLTIMAFVVQALAQSLRRFPVFNATFDADNKQVVYKEYFNLGVAVDSERGLVVPIMRNVERMDLHTIAAELRVLADKVRAVSFTVDELRGGSFTVSNAGAAGGANRYSTPIINHPESAILALGRARNEPRYVPDLSGHQQLEPRLILPLSLTFDHRATDGAESSRFLGDVIDQLENPARLLLG